MKVLYEISNQKFLYPLLGEMIPGKVSTSDDKAEAPLMLKFWPHMHMFGATELLFIITGKSYSKSAWSAFQQ